MSQLRSCRIGRPSPPVEADGERRLRRVTLVASVTSKRIPIRTSPDRRRRSHVVYRLSDRCRPQATPAVRADFFRVDFLRTPTEKGVADLTCWASTRGNANRSPDAPSVDRGAARRRRVRARRVDGRRGARQPAAPSSRPAAVSQQIVSSPARGGHSPGSATRAPSGGSNTARPSDATGDATTPGRPAPGSAAPAAASSSTCATGTSPCPPAARASPTPCASPISTATQPVLRGRPPARRRGVHRQRGRRHHEEQHLPALRAARDERRPDGAVVQPHRHAHA